MNGTIALSAFLLAVIVSNNAASATKSTEHPLVFANEKEVYYLGFAAIIMLFIGLLVGAHLRSPFHIAIVAILGLMIPFQFSDFMPQGQYIALGIVGILAFGRWLWPHINETSSRQHLASVTTLPVAASMNGRRSITRE